MPPSDMAAVIDQAARSWWIYYVNTDGLIRYYMGPETGTSESSQGDKPYEGPHSVQVGGVDVKANAEQPKLAVVDYKPSGGALETRIYYLNRNNEVNEVCWTSGRTPNEWYHGSLNTARFKAAPGSLLTAAVDDHWLKVYFQRADIPDELSVAWVVTGEKSWTPRTIATGF